jgi:hypothetical protein
MREHMVLQHGEQHVQDACIAGVALLGINGAA